MGGGATGEGVVSFWHEGSSGSYSQLTASTTAAASVSAWKAPVLPEAA